MKRGPRGLWIPDWDGHASAIAEHAQRYTQFKSAWAGRSGLAIDGGAHVGYWTRLMAEDFEAVEAFEPQTDNFACLKRNMEEFDNVQINYAALGDRVDFCQPAPNERSRADNSGAWHVKPGAGNRRMLRLDDLFEVGPLDLIKLDVEGLEAAVLRGGELVIHEYKPVIIIEQNNTSESNFGTPAHEARDLLTRWGYRHAAQAGRDHCYAHPEAPK